MELVIRTASLYVVVLLVLRLAGRRALSEMTTFDLLLLLMISETTREAILGDDRSLTGAAIAILTLAMVDVVLSLLKAMSPRLERILEGVPTVIMRDGQLLHDRLRRARLDEDDLLEQARLSRGVDDLSGVRHAVLERTGAVSILPYDKPKDASHRGTVAP